MQLSIRKLLSVRYSLNGSHCGISKQGSELAFRAVAFLIYEPKIIIHFLAFKSQTLESHKHPNEWTREWTSLIYGVHMRIALSLAIIKFEGQFGGKKSRKKKRKNQLRERKATHNDPMVKASIYLHIKTRSQFNINRH